MKYLVLAMFVLFAAQPMQAAACDMHDDQSGGHSQHANMHDNDNQGMDCCDDQSADTGDGCGSMDQCGACPAGLVAVKPLIVSIVFDNGFKPLSAVGDAPMCRFSSPPFRPPIS